MLSIPQSVRIYFSPEPTDMRKGFDSLAALVVHQGLDLYSGHLFVFMSQRRDRVKILTWDRGGFVMYYKRLELGKFKKPRVDKNEGKVLLDASELMMLLDGLDITHIKRPKFWSPKKII